MDDRLILGKAHAEKELQKALSDTSIHNIINSEQVIIKEESDAIKIAEVILFSIYSKENIVKQYPYEVYYIDNYWIISGTLPKGWRGGTFLIILDSRNSAVLRITHGK